MQATGRSVPGRFETKVPELLPRSPQFARAVAAAACRVTALLDPVAEMSARHAARHRTLEHLPHHRRRFH